MNGGARLLPLFLVALFLAALAGALSNVAGPRAYLPRLLFLGSAVCFIAFLYRGRRELQFLFLRFRRTAEPGPALTWILSGAILLVASVLMARLPVQMDATSRGVNRLSAASRAVLARIETPIEMIGIYRETSPSRARAADLLDIYRASSRRVKVRMLDPDRRPDEARDLGITHIGIVLIRSEDGKVKEEVSELDEDDLTQAVLRVLYPGRTSLAFVTGHEERSIEDSGPGGLARFAAALRQSGYAPTELPLLTQEIPADVATLLILGPRREFLPNEIDKLGRFLDGGGRLLICLEPGTTAGLDGLFRSRGVVVDSAQVYDESPGTRGLGLGPRTVVVTDYPSHEIVGGIGYTVFPGAGPVGLTKDPSWGIDAKVLLRTGRDARLVAPRPGGTGAPYGEPASRPLGVEEEWEVPARRGEVANPMAPVKPYARMVVVGNVEWLTGQFLDVLSNRDLAIRVVHWLSRRDFLLKIPPPDTRGTPLRIGLGGLRTLFYLLQVALPLTLLGTGLWLWSRRR